VIDGTRQHARKLRRAHSAGKGRNLGRGFRNDAVVVLGRAEVEQDGSVVDVACQLLYRRELLFDARASSVDCLSFLPIVPEPWSESLLLERLNFGFELGDVKDAPLAP
jgi:hypothetical protein